VKGHMQITQQEMTDLEIEFAERVARRLGFTQTAYTSSSALIGLFCLPDRSTQREGCLVQTREFGLLFVQDLEDLNLHKMADEERALMVCK
jgi:hypothetical protein